LPASQLQSQLSLLHLCKQVLHQHNKGWFGGTQAAPHPPTQSSCLTCCLCVCAPLCPYADEIPREVTGSSMGGQVVYMEDGSDDDKVEQLIRRSQLSRSWRPVLRKALKDGDDVDSVVSGTQSGVTGSGLLLTSHGCNSKQGSQHRHSTPCCSCSPHSSTGSHNNTTLLLLLLAGVCAGLR
jgi:hypothetical protein